MGRSMGYARSVGNSGETDMNSTSPKSKTFRVGVAAAMLLALTSVVVLINAHAENAISYYPADSSEQGKWTGRLERVDAHLVILTVRGTASERGEAHGRLLGAEVAILVASVRKNLSRDGAPNYKKCVDGARTMAAFVDPDVVTELKACAAAAKVDADELMLAQLFGDVNRANASSCSAFAAFGEATTGGKLLVGRNFDYAGNGLEGGVPLILQEIPTGEGAGHSFVTLGYAGILNGWTAMNTDGLCASNNTLYGGKDSLEGMSTCFMLRHIVEYASTVEQGVELIQKSKRACTTGMMVAGKNAAGAWDARFVEYDSKNVAVVEPVHGIVQATNRRQKLVFGDEKPDSLTPMTCARYETMKKHLDEWKGTLSFEAKERNPTADKHVYMGINLHSALLDPAGQRIRAAFATGDGAPAGEKVFRDFDVLPASVMVHK